ncbi:lipid II:glycine glycyltransferase FemX [Trueperella pecoris]|uniref:lipid II:glycine glycyltransferase FemX n=1 Tax=Trueperella pecoris TaxID=2733571 RepID=UPI001ABE9BE4|nr:GNAT family N-acetyltransferase [Trueperella pecoris]QTG75556.1 GNAT family N-acetyltransferase [Trueperella pecoris]
MSFELTLITAQELRAAAAGVKVLPIEQSDAWDTFEQRCGRSTFGRYAFSRDGKTLALISLAEHEIRGVKFLWAKKGPVWLRSQSPANEAALRAALKAAVRQHNRGARTRDRIAFIRLHAKYSAPDLHGLLNTITYDHTVIINTCGGNEADILAAMPKDGRRAVRRAMDRMKKAGAKPVDLTGISRADFVPVYAVLRETAERNDFSIHPMEVYWNMLDALGPEHARLFAVEHAGAIVAWVLVLVNDGHACQYYGAHSHAAREVLASQYLDFWSAKVMGEEGVASLDLMGVDSMRFPDLYELGINKRRYAERDVEVDGAWDLPVIPVLYNALAIAKRGKTVATSGKALAQDGLALARRGAARARDIGRRPAASR